MSHINASVSVDFFFCYGTSHVLRSTHVNTEENV